MSKAIKVGDKVRFVNRKAHEQTPEYYPSVGTIGTVVMDECNPKDWKIQWPKGTTSGDDRWYCGEESIELFDGKIEKDEMTNEEIWEMLKSKMEKNSLKSVGTIVHNLTDKDCSKLKLTRVYAENDVHNAIALAYKVGYLRSQKGRPFKIGEKKKKGGHWEPVDPNNLPKEGIRVRYKGGIKKCNWEKNKKGIWVTNETDRFVIRFNDVDWSIWCMNELLKYFDMWVEDDE